MSAETIFLSDPQTVSMADEWYQFATSDHFWMQWRWDSTKKLLGQKINQSLVALDIGSGQGVFAKQVEADSKISVDCCDLNPQTFSGQQLNRGRWLCYNILDRHPDVIGSYDLVFLMDVIEHIDDEAQFLAAAIDHLKPGGAIVLNVPANPLLYSRYDEVAGHVRRYSASSLRQVLANAGLRNIRIRPWGFSMIPVLVLRKLWLARLPREKVIATGFHPNSPTTDKVLRLFFRMETFFDAAPPCGTSLLAYAEK